MQSDYLNLYQNILRDTFQLRSPVHVRVSRQCRLDGEDCYGLYYGEYINPRRSLHSIRISRKMHRTPEEWFATLAHEYVHAWQTEQGLDLDHDEESGFERWREYFWQHWGLDLVA